MLSLRLRRPRWKTIASQPLYEFNYQEVYEKCMFVDLERLSSFIQIISGIWLG